MGGSSNTQYPAALLSGLYSGANNAFSIAPQASNQAFGQAQGLLQNPNLSPYANTAFTQGQQIYGATAPKAEQVFAAGSNEANALFPYVGQALQQGFDPQQALYGKLFQQQQDQSRAENAASGVATTPYGAGLTQTGNQNFDIAWQQAQLANQAQGANTASQLAGAGMGALGTGANAASNLFGTGIGAVGTGASAATGLYNTLPQQIQEILNYINTSNQGASGWLGGVNQSTQAANNLYGQQQYGNLAQQGINNQALGGIGSLLGQLGGGYLSGGYA